MNSRGLIHFYYGDGKGKTSAGIGACVRAVGQGLNVGVAQFLKDGSSGEVNILKNNNVFFFDFFDDIKFTNLMSKQQFKDSKKFYSDLILQISSSLEKFDLVFLDEVGSAIQSDLVSLESVLNMLENKPEATEIIITAHKNIAQISNIAHYVTYMEKIKHPYENNIAARKGIEW